MSKNNDNIDREKYGNKNNHNSKKNWIEILKKYIIMKLF